MINSSHLKNFFVFIIFISVLGSCNSYTNLEIGNIKGMQIENISSSKIKFKILIPIKNPNNFRIKITDYDLLLEINNKKFGNIKSTEKIIIPAKSDKIHELPGEIEFKGLFSSASLIIINILKSKQILLHAVGTLNVKAVMVKRKIEINETQKIDIQTIKQKNQAY